MIHPIIEEMKDCRGAVLPCPVALSLDQLTMLLPNLKYPSILHSLHLNFSFQAAPQPVGYAVLPL